MSTASDMIAMLRRHYIADETRPAGIFAPEITAPGSSGRRADLIWLGCTAASGSELIGHEVKVTRADLMTELADLTKSDPWQRYCSRWWLVVPDVALAEGLDIPETWGILTPPSGRRTRSCTITRPAPRLTPVEQSPALRAIASRLHWSGHNAEMARAESTAESNRLRARVSELTELVPGQWSARKRREVEVVEQIVKALGGVDAAGRIGPWHQQVSSEAVVTALRDLAAIEARCEDARRSLARTRSEMQSLIRHMQLSLDAPVDQRSAA